MVVIVVVVVLYDISMLEIGLGIGIEGIGDLGRIRDLLGIWIWM